MNQVNQVKEKLINLVEKFNLEYNINILIKFHKKNTFHIVTSGHNEDNIVDLIDEISTIDNIYPDYSKNYLAFKIKK